VPALHQSLHRSFRSVLLFRQSAAENTESLGLRKTCPESEVCTSHSLNYLRRVTCGHWPVQQITQLETDDRSDRLSWSHFECDDHGYCFNAGARL
jgi:hypothetical protein